MDLNLTYPATVAEHYAKGTATTAAGDVYFEVPAVFRADGTCDENATLAAVVEAVETHLAMSGTNG